MGKTTTAVNLAAYLAAMGKFVLLVDLDPQANATSGLGVNHLELEKGVYEAMSKTHGFKDIVVPTGQEGYSLAPATAALAGANVELVSLDRREYQLLDMILEARTDYDYIIIDCPPSLGLLTINGLVAADSILIPVQSEYYALEGLGSLMETVELIKENYRPELNILGAVLTMYDKRNKLSHEVLQSLYQYFPDKIFRSVIPRSVRLAESPSHGKTILEYDPKSKPARAYEKLAWEIIDATS